MDYNSLKYIIAVDKHQSISKAAEELYLTQPNISKAIQTVEKEIGIDIFTRTSRGVTTTQEGKEFIKKAIKIVKNFDEFTKEFTNSEKSIFNLNIAHPKDIHFQNKLIDFANNFNSEKDININISEGTTEEIIEMVLRENVNLGVICVNEHDLAYYKKLLVLNNLDFSIKSAQKLKITMHTSNPLSNEKSLSKDMLRNQTLITTNTNDYYRYYNEKYHITLGKNVIKLGVSFNQLSILSKVDNSYLLSLPVTDEILKEFNCNMINFDYGIGDWVTIVIYKKNNILTELEKQFIKLI